MALKVFVLFVSVTLIIGQPTKPEISTETERSLCNEDDPIDCLKYKVISFLEQIFKKDNFQITENIKVKRNNYRSNEISRSDDSIEKNVEEYVKSHDVTVKLPIIDSTVTLDARKLDTNELNLKLNFNSNQVEARKSKLKKILIPILVFVLLKAITLVPLALGLLGLKAWNALQLSFLSFIVSVGLAVFQLCKKIASDNTAAHSTIAAHAPWEPTYANYIARTFEGAMDGLKQADNQQMAYSGYVH